MKSARIFFAVLIFLSFYIPLNARQKKVYIHYKTGDSLHWYYLFKEEFYRAIFSPEYEISVGHKSKHLKGYDYIVTDEVPHNDIVLKNLAKYPREKLLLFNFEPPLQQVRSQITAYHQIYAKVFTWNDDLIDNVKYFKVSFPWMNPPRIVEWVPFIQKRKLCMLSAQNNVSNSPCENYSSRRELIDFFEKLGGDEFDLYGNWWPSSYKTWRGIITHDDIRGAKVEVLKNYKFDICYENSRGLRGYISERIFDAFLAGTLPVYMGSSNITDYVPADCFIARDQFKSNEELYNFLKSMDQDTYEAYRKNIKNYLENNGGYQLSSYYQISQIKKVLGIS